MELKEIHKGSSRHRDAIINSEKCGCFHCTETFYPTEIKDWVDNEQTARCPKCGIDSVIPETNEVQLTNDLLGSLFVEYFNY